MIVGVDISTHRIDTAWLDADGRPQRWHQDLGKGATIDRLRRIRVDWPGYTNHDGSAEDPHEIVIEEPWGRGKALAPLHQVLGIVTRQAPSWARVAHVSSGDLRRAIGAANTKASAHERIKNGCVELPTMWNATWDEHSLDALVACIAWQRILGQQDAA